MRKADLYTKNGEKKGEIELPDSVFDVPVKEGPVYYALRGYMANLRRGTASTKTKGEVSYSGTKPWRQKGTGRARVGTRGSPVWVGGGVAMGPKPRDYSHSVPRKVRRAALRSVLTGLAIEGRIVVLEELEVPKPKTKALVELMDRMGISSGSSCLILLEKKDENVKLSVRNIPRLDVKLTKDINALDLMRCDWVIATKKSIELLREVFAA
jgi:large subunit ribosomal protein L4